jgi:hypothetical protein
MNRHRFLHCLDPASNIVYETSSNINLGSFAGETSRTLFLVDLLINRAIFPRLSIHAALRVSLMAFNPFHSPCFLTAASLGPGISSGLIIFESKAALAAEMSNS